jgi:hypothetical protein
LDVCPQKKFQLHGICPILKLQFWNMEKYITGGCVCKTLNTSSKYIVISRSYMRLILFILSHWGKKNQKNANSYYYWIASNHD